MDTFIDYFLYDNSISLADKKTLNNFKGTGFARDNKIFYIKGQKTTLNCEGCGIWKNKKYINGKLDHNFPDENLEKKISKKYDRSSNKIFINNKLNLHYSGFILKEEGAPCITTNKGCYFIDGCQTSLDENGTGVFLTSTGNVEYYVFGKKINFDSNKKYSLKIDDNFYKIFSLIEEENFKTKIYEAENFSGFIEKSGCNENSSIDFFYDKNLKKLLHNNKNINGIFFINNQKTTLDESGSGFTFLNDKCSGWYFNGELIHSIEKLYSGWCPIFNVYFKNNTILNLNQSGNGLIENSIYFNEIKILNLKPVKKIKYDSINFFEDEKYTGWASLDEGAADSLQYYVENQKLKYKKNKGTFYLNGKKTTLNFDGNGIILYPKEIEGIYFNGVKSNLNIKLGGVWESKKYKKLGEFDENFTGLYKNIFFIKGVATNLDDQGTGIIDNNIFYKGKIIKEYTGFLTHDKHNAPNTLAYDEKYYNGTFYYKGKPTTLNRLGCGVWFYNLKYVYFLYGKPTTLYASNNKTIKYFLNLENGRYEASGFGFGVWDDKTGEKIFIPPNIKNKSIHNTNFLTPTPVLNKKNINGFISKELGATEFSIHTNNGGCWYVNGIKSPLNCIGEGYWSVDNAGKMNKVQAALDLTILKQINLLLGTYYVSYINSSNKQSNAFALATSSLDENGSGYWVHPLFKFPFWVNGKNTSNFTGWISYIAGAPTTGFIKNEYSCKKLDIYNSIISNLGGTYYENGKPLGVNEWDGYETDHIHTNKPPEI